MSEPDEGATVLLVTEQDWLDRTKTRRRLAKLARAAARERRPIDEAYERSRIAAIDAWLSNVAFLRKALSVDAPK